MSTEPISAPPRPRPRRRGFVLLAAVAAVTAVAVSKGCSTPIANRNPTGEPFPVVVGQSLEEERIELPSAFGGSPVILLVGYEQRTQFDIDRWLMGLLQSGVDARIVEIPTIPGLLPTIASGWIDDGMRAGIPREDWGAVVTLYGGSAQPVADLTGTEMGQRTRVLVLDADGTVVWFDDTGYSVSKAMAVAELVADLAVDEQARPSVN